jgi:hypothetical protein
MRILKSVVTAACLVATVLLPVMAAATQANAQVPTPVECTGGDVPVQGINSGGPPNTQSQPDLLVDGTCTVRPGHTYYYANINIRKSGVLAFTETHADRTTPGNEQTDLWASGIIVENAGAMTAGTAAVPYGSAGTHTGTLTIHLYGKDQSNGNPLPPSPPPGGNGPGQGVLCKTPQVDGSTGPCGIPWTKWIDNGKTQFTDLPGGVTDFFYRYGPLYGDSLGTPFSESPYNAGSQGYFGYKVLGVSYGGTLQLFGYKGTPTGVTPAATSSANSWIRLAADLTKNATTLTLDTAPGTKWQPGDEIVVTTTDYVPGHSETLKIKSIAGNVVTLDPTGGLPQWTHSGTRYKLKPSSAVLARLNLDSDLTTNGVESRAAVGLLTRSIRIVSAGDAVNEPFPAAPATPPGYFFGGHTVFRQGFQSVQVQGVEFAQLGQGGRMGHYPVHFHMVRQVPANTYVEDSSVNESMTRWYVLHSTEGVTLARNIGYLSIGHGFYLEDGTEANNSLYSNLGVYARAAMTGAPNPRGVPGILAQNGVGPALALTSDAFFPTAFWITNGWNDFIGNMAAGAGACGSCYWLTPSISTDMPDVPNGSMHMKWTGYAGLSDQFNLGGATPLKSFYKNYCTSAQNSFETVLDIGGCNGASVAQNAGQPADGLLHAVKSVAPNGNPAGMTYYPNIAGNRNPIVCPGGDCTLAQPCNGQDPQQCAVTALDHYTSAFNWAEQNVSALWLRTNWYLMTDSVISDVQTGGLTFVSGGDYTKSSVPQGYWALASNSVFIGQTQPNNPYASNLGPYNHPGSDLTCANKGNACINVADGVSLPLSNFATGQRLFNIYDGPDYQDSNAYLDITPPDCNSLATCIYYNLLGVRKNPGTGKGYLPDAAIGWKQPNGFFYPPAFHSANLLFDNVGIRHYVIAPLFNLGTYLTNPAPVANDYIVPNPGYFTGYTDIDRQTELSDDDGSLTGLVGVSNPTSAPNTLGETISVNEDPFFNGPVATPECDSNLGISPTNACKTPPAGSTTPTARTSPYDYFTTVVYPKCAINGQAPTQPAGPNTPPPIAKQPCGVTPPPSANSKEYPNAVQPWLPINITVNGIGYQQFDYKAGRAGEWSKDCAGPFCFGVKLYRQFLTGTDNKGVAGSSREWLTWYNAGCLNTPANCDWPYDRMAGEASWQRSVLTANNGTYYLDTTPSNTVQVSSPYAGLATNMSDVFVDCTARRAQPAPTNEGNCQPRSVNVFKANETYYVMLLFAKSTTHAVYQIYVGDNFNLSTVTGVAIKSNTINFDLQPNLPADWPAASQWLKPAPHLIAGPDGKMDILQVEVDLTAFGTGGALNPLLQATGLCRPKSFCDWGANGASGCGCMLQKPPTPPGLSSDPRVAANPGFWDRCQATCQTWAVKDASEPAGGIVGFSFTMPDGFMANDKNERPTPTVYPGTEKSGWAAAFKQTTVPPDSTGATGSTCHYTNPLPGQTDCAIVDAPLVPQ